MAEHVRVRPGHVDAGGLGGVPTAEITARADITD